MSNAAPSDSPQANILVVDDTPANLHLLVGLLAGKGHKVRPVSNGDLALRAVQANPPDLILLDVAMPGIDGYEVCRRLKANTQTRDIPVIFISAHDGSEDKLRAFETGGVDYVSKPFQVEEVLARVAAHLTIRRQQLHLENSYRQLRQLENLRDSLTHMVVHDMRSPLLTLSLGLEYLSLELGNHNKDLASMVTTAQLSVKNLVGLVNQMLDVSRLEAGTMKLNRVPVNLHELASEVIGHLGPAAAAHDLRLSASRTLSANVDPQIIRRVLENLIGNALKFTPAGGVITLSVSEHRGTARIEVTDTGPGIDPAHHEKIFEKFGQVESAGAPKGYGLGLAFARMAVEAHGGKMGVTSAVGKGSTFWFTL